jgi:hypothetical protein
MPRKVTKPAVESLVRVSCVRPGVLVEFERIDTFGIRHHDWLGVTIDRLAFSPESVVAASIPTGELPPDLYDAIYFLIRRGKVCYVGRSGNVGLRLQQHAATGRKWEAVAVIAGIHPDSLETVEHAYLHAWEPPWNVARVSGHNRFAASLRAQLAAMPLDLVCKDPEFPPFTEAEIEALLVKMDRMFEPE